MATIMRTSVAYRHHDGRMGYEGLNIEAGGFSSYMYERVSSRFYDLEGAQNLADMVGSIPGFDTANLVTRFLDNAEPQGWKIGEKFGECYLEDYREASLLYNSSRDVKNPKSSPTGADLVGLITIENRTVFLFGEIKTSKDKRQPPRLVYGEGGLICQLNRTKSQKEVRWELVKWLGHKLVDLDDSDLGKISYKKTAQSYITSSRPEFMIFGVMVRDVVVAPQERDLAPVLRSIKETDDGAHLELLALYIPVRISTLASLLGDPVNGA